MPFGFRCVSSPPVNWNLSVKRSAATTKNLRYSRRNNHMIPPQTVFHRPKPEPLTTSVNLRSNPPLMEAMPELKRPRGPREEAHFPSLWGWNRLLRKLLYVMQGLNVLLENLMKRPTEARDLHPPRHRLPDPEEERAPAPRTPTRTTSEASWERMSLNSELLQASPGSSQGDVTQLLEEMKEIVGPPPKCGHGRLCRLFLSRTAKNNRRLFWRCPMDRQGQCSTFQWCNRQPLRPDLDHLEEPSPQPMRRGAPSSSTTPQVPPLPRRCPHRNISRAGTNAFKIMEKCLDCNRTLVDEPTPLGMEKAQKRQEQKDQKSLYITRLTRQHPGAQYQEGYPPPRYPIYQEDMNNLTPAMARRLQQSGALQSGGIWEDGPYQG